MLSFRGLANDEVVLTTPNASYQVRTVQTSNSLMICAPPVEMVSTPTTPIEPNETPKKVSRWSMVDVCTGTLELTRIPPRVERLHQLFATSTGSYYAGPDVERTYTSKEHVRFFSAHPFGRACDAESKKSSGSPWHR